MDQNQEDNEAYNIFKKEYDSLEVHEENALSEVAVVSETKSHNNRHRKRKHSIILGSLALLVILALIGGGVVLLRPKPPKQTNITINTQSLDNGTLNKITVAVGGEAKQQLTITPDTLFKNNVEIDKDLTVRGQTFLQSPVTITKELAVGSNLGVGGNLSVTGKISAGNLSVGSVTIGSLKLSGSLEFNGHFMPTGTVPSIKVDFAAAGGTATINGSDTAGTITIVTGSGAGPTGEMAVITFTSSYSGTPKVQLTPVSGPAAKLDYFVSRSAGFFTVEAASAPTANSSYSFDYLVSE